MTITSDTNFAAKSGEGMVIIDEDQATEEFVYSASKSSNTLSTPLVNRGLEGGSAQAHAITASVKGIITAGMWNDLIDTLTNIVDQTTGLIKSSLAFTSPVLTTPQINDASSDHQYVFAGSELTADRTVTLPLLTGADTFVFADHTQTVTNKRITKRVGTVTSHATPSINTDNVDMFTITALAEVISSMTTNLSGTPTNGQTLVIRLLDNGTARAITWGASFASRGATLPTTTTLSKYTYVGLIWNSTTSTWDCVAAVTEA